eukprot:3468236-Prymnesium_polylepis.1
MERAAAAISARKTQWKRGTLWTASVPRIGASAPRRTRSRRRWAPPGRGETIAHGRDGGWQTQR